MGRTILFGSILVLCACGRGGGIQTLTIEIEGEGTVSFVREGDPDVAIRECPSTCEDEVTAGSGFEGWTISASPAEGWAFARWEQGSGETARTCEDTDASRFLGPQNWSCRAVFIGCAGTDPRDLADDPAGDPTVDLRCISVGVDGDGRPYVRVQMELSWEPPDYYSWYTTVTLVGSAGVLGSRTEELHDGARETITTGQVTAANSSLEINPGVAGYQMSFAEALATEIVNVVVETGILKTADGEFRMDGPVQVDF